MNDFVYVVCEGQSETSFVKNVLSPYILQASYGKRFLIPYTVITSNDKRRGRVYRGGILEYSKPKNDILICLKKGRPVTTMFDFYRLPNDFPGHSDIDRFPNDNEKIRHLEQVLSDDIDNPLFLPYLQLHEFEALFYCDLDILKEQYIDEQNAIEQLKSEVEGIAPEDINGGENTSPSKRLMSHFAYQKGNVVMLTLGKIGIEKMREKCPHFSEWVERLLTIGCE